MFLDRYIINIRKKTESDNKGLNYVDVLIKDQISWKLKKEFCKFNMKQDNANIYINFLKNDWKLENENYKDYFLYKEAFNKLKNKKEYFIEDLEEGWKELPQIELRLDLYKDEDKEELENKKRTLSYINAIKNQKKLFENINIEEFNSYFKELENNQEILLSTESNSLKKNFRFRLIYWTTLMEESNLSEYKAKQLYQNKKTAADFDEKEFSNLKKSFDYVDKKITQTELNLSLVQDIHTNATMGLDIVKPLKELNYKSGVFRNKIVKMMWKHPTPWFKDSIELAKILNEVLINTNEINWFGKIIYFHIFFYTLHPFFNWNKRTTRLLEFFLIKRLFPLYYDKILGMGYYFYKQKEIWRVKIEKCIIDPCEDNIKDFITFYIKSFKLMLEDSIKEIQLALKLKEYKERYLDNQILFEIYEYLLKNRFFKLVDLRISVTKKIFQKETLSWFDIEKLLFENFSKDFLVLDDKIKYYESKIFISKNIFSNK